MIYTTRYMYRGMT